MSRTLLILDLDETLVHATEKPLAHPASFRVPPYHVYRRPFLNQFLDRCGELFELAIWTSSTEDYAEAVVNEIWSHEHALSFVWSRSRCTYRVDRERGHAQWIKDLKKVRKCGYALERVLMVDDSPRKLSRQYGNLVRVGSFVGDPEDDELYWLGLYLPKLAQVENVRRVEKRGWRTQVQ
ncbi:MAG: HAD family hydrolase [Rhodothermales bacterium]|nr:HAD family hydrolase [Rhodothermales bacterium]